MNNKELLRKLAISAGIILAVCILMLIIIRLRKSRRA